MSDKLKNNSKKLWLSAILNCALKMFNSAPVMLTAPKGSWNETEYLISNTQSLAASRLYFSPGEKDSPTTEAYIFSHLISSNYS